MGISASSIPIDYEAPSFPALGWPPEDPYNALYTSYDTWRFTLLWTLILYAIFHIGVTAIAVFIQVAKRPSSGKYLWPLPFLYTFIAGLQALVAGSVVGVLLGTVFFSADFAVSTWIPFIWGWINILVLVISSFTNQGGL